MEGGMLRRNRCDGKVFLLCGPGKRSTRATWAPLFFRSGKPVFEEHSLDGRKEGRHRAPRPRGGGEK